MYSSATRLYFLPNADNYLLLVAKNDQIINNFIFCFKEKFRIWIQCTAEGPKVKDGRPIIPEIEYDAPCKIRLFLSFLSP